MSQSILHLDELAKAAGVSARTVRYYISLGLLPGPTMGRNAHYTSGHLAILQRIVEAQKYGKSLGQIKAEFDTHGYIAPTAPPEDADLFKPPAFVFPTPFSPDPTGQWYSLAPDVGVVVRDTTDARKRVVQEAITVFARAVHVMEKERE